MNGLVRALSTENRSMGTNQSQTVPIYRPSADERARTIQQIEVQLYISHLILFSDKLPTNEQRHFSDSAHLSNVDR